MFFLPGNFARKLHPSLPIPGCFTPNASACVPLAKLATWVFPSKKRKSWTQWKIWTTTSRLTTITPCKNAMFNTSNAHSRKTSQWQMKASCEGVVECPKSGVILLRRWIKSPVNSSIPNTWGSIGINLPGCLSSLVLKWATERERERWVYYSEGPERSLWSYWGLGKSWIIVHSTSELWKT